MAYVFQRALKAQRPLVAKRWLTTGQSSTSQAQHIESTFNNDTEISSASTPTFSSLAPSTEKADLVHVKMSYLHSSSKTPPSIVRAGDMRSGRIRPDPIYVPLSAQVFSTPPRRDLLHSAVVYYLDSRRKGLASTKTRGEVAFSGAKIRPQKGSGKARLGPRGNPLLRKGGVIHGPKPRDMSSKLNRRVRELALRSALSAKWLQNNLAVVKNLDWIDPPSTGELAKLLRSRKWEDVIFLTAPRHPQAATILHPKINPKPSATDPFYTEEQIKAHEASTKRFIIASNNLPTLETIQLHKLKMDTYEESKKPQDLRKPGELHAYHVLKRRMLVCDLGAIEWLEEKLGGSIFHPEELEGIARDLKAIDEAEVTEDADDAYVSDDIVEEADRVVDTVEPGKEDIKGDAARS